ncbi:MULTISPECIES: hypothetical protein [Enterobacterales]|uniref:hypothetical protein n=1 Tax=Enterobacterales TaxID=91347 RepID=UPI0018827A31|nr:MULTISPECIES: hypothetical protein [Enterobacterales]EEY8699755.1 hypothetical protein [Escherichia coli]MBE8908041.1 hypothetical protein [Enterobacter asburiae]MBF7970323.1 hypothetical protein [Escherichia coli]MBJ9123217.1 hypothetical protein [Citrobacter koseri]MDM3066626.1 hypothetical protein [Citrobacter sp. CK180]
MIKSKTRIELDSSKMATENSLKRKVELHIYSEEIPSHVWDAMMVFFQTKSKATVVKHAMIYLSGVLVNSEKSYFDQLKYDSILDVIKGRVFPNNFKLKKTMGENVLIKIPYWQVALISSSLPKCHSANEFIKISLEEVYKKLFNVFHKEGS